MAKDPMPQKIAGYYRTASILSDQCFATGRF